MIALSAGVWLARIIELTLSPIIGVISFLMVLVAVRFHERRLLNFAIATSLIGLTVSTLQVFDAVDESELSMIENRLVLEGEFRVESDSQPYGDGFKTWVVFESAEFSPTLGSLIGENGEYRWGERYASKLSLEANWQQGRGHFIATEMEPSVLISKPQNLQSVIGEIRSSFLENLAGVDPDSAGLVAGLAVGERTLLSEQTSENMRKVALTHLVAVSGANCAIVLASVYFGLGLLRVRRTTRFVAALFSLVIYVLVVGFDPSVLRAGFMAATVIVAMWLGRGVKPLRALALSMIILLSFDPWLCIDFAFALSVFSTLGILVLAPAIYQKLHRLPKALAVGLSVSFSAQLYCIPVMLMLQPELPVFGVIANVLSEPVVAPVTVLGITAVFLSPVFPVISSLLSLVASFGTWWIARVANTLAPLPQSTLPWPNDFTGLALAVVLAFAISLAVLSERYKTLAVVTIILMVSGSTAGYVEKQLRVYQFADQKPQVVNCDVGQGDALIIRSNENTMLIDVGRDPRSIEACLRSNRIHHIDVLMLSHFDFDHVGGIEGLHAVSIGKVLVSGFNDQREAVDRVTEFMKERNVPMTVASRGKSGDFGNGFWEILSPTTSASGAEDANDASLVAIIQLPKLQVLATGDIGRERQDQILQQGLQGRVDAQKPLVLKVSHHGSADQSNKFHESLSPELSIISVGENSYGHPDTSLISKLKSVGSTVLRTDTQGMVGIDSTEGLKVFATGKL